MTVVAIGIDVAKATITVARWQAGTGTKLGSLPNTPAGFAQLAQLLPAGVPIRLTLEPTGGYELPLVHFALAQGWEVCLPNPKQVRDFGKSRGIRAKTDAQDALLLARYGAEADPPAWHPLPAEVAELESLQRRKDDLEQLLRQERNRHQALTGRPGQHQAVPASLGRVIEVLEAEVKGVERAIKDHLKRYAALGAAVTRLRSVPGVGPQTVVPLLVVLWRWRVLTDGQGSAKGVTA
jgi:transposase